MTGTALNSAPAYIETSHGSGLCVNTPPAKASGFVLRLKAGLIGHPTD
jgi:hypothetical protein